jgi:hypothetical protein
MNTDASRNGNFPGISARRGQQARTANTDSGFSFTTLPPGHTTDAPDSPCGKGVTRREKMAAPCGTAKFREETSKKADSVTRGHIAAAHNVDG